jgi:hypothetical protein
MSDTSGTGSKFATDINNITTSEENLPPVSMTPVANNGKKRQTAYTLKPT